MSDAALSSAGLAANLRQSARRKPLPPSRGKVGMGVKSAPQRQIPLCALRASAIKSPRSFASLRLRVKICYNPPCYSREENRMTTATPDLKKKSRVVTDGPDRAGARAMLRATGLDDADMDKPFVAVGNLASDVTPCNVHLDRQAQKGQGRTPRQRQRPLPVRHHNHQRRHIHGNRRHEGVPSKPRSHSRLHRNRNLRRKHGRPNRCRRLRQEYARRNDGHSPVQRPVHLRLWRRHNARQLARQRHKHTRYVRSHRRLLARADNPRRAYRNGARRLSRAKAPAPECSPPTPCRPP